MKSHGLHQLASCGLAGVLVLLLSAATTGVPREVLDVNLSPMIEQSAQYPTRFAVNVPHAVVINQSGAWTQNGTTSTWTYAIRIPSAVSLSFHASKAYFPPGAVLEVAGASNVIASYRGRDIARSGLWSRPFPGNELVLSLTLSTADRSRVALQIDSFQAGYRGLGRGVQDNPYYRHIMQQAPQASSCSVNYACAATAANEGAANATVAIVVGNVLQCTGTLLNNTSGDGTPYVLTARHCENGTLGGGDPTAADSVTVYWDAESACNSPLGSIYDGTAITQSGATTVVEQQDAWLIKLDANPAASDAYYAGWDVTGGVISGGYSIHHALGNDKQYVGWNGQAILQSIPAVTLNLKYASTFWGVVNAQGSVGAGASGGALFDSNNNAVGSASLADLASGANSAGVCPLTPPAAPSPSTVVADYTSLSAVWDSTADSTSSTGGMTLQSVLDSANTGQRVVAGVGLIPVALSVDQSYPGTGQTVHISWSAPGGQTCSASGGLDGDGWAGSQSISGTLALTEQSAGQVTYRIRCIGPNVIGSASVTVTWQLIPAFVSVTGSGPTAVTGRLVNLHWQANTAPCTATGGTDGDGWQGTKTSSGSQDVLASVLGTINYTLTCGSGGRTAIGQYTIDVVAPSAGPIYGDANQLRVGQSVALQFAGGGACVASGGATGDGWAGPLGASAGDSGVLGYTIAVTESVAGTYTYTVTCSGAGPTANLSSSSSITLTFTGAAPSASLLVSPTPVEIYTDTGAYNSVLNLSWSSNVRPCSIAYAGPGNTQGTINGLDAGMPTGTALDDQQVAGTYVYTITCGTGQSLTRSSASAVWFTNSPAVTLSVQDPAPLGGGAVSWQSNVYPCTGTGGESGDGWAGLKAGASGSQNLVESTLGTVNLGITCGTGPQTAQAQTTAAVTVITPTVSITANASTLPVDGTLVLQWNANFEPCTSSISPGNGNWGTLLPKSSGFQTTQQVAGTYIYTIICASAQASVQVTFTGSLTTLAASASNAVVNTPVTLTWQSPPNSSSCMATGGSGGDGWPGAIPGGGSRMVTSPNAGTIGYSISCNVGSGVSQATTQITYTSLTSTEPAVPVPSVTLSTGAPTQEVGSFVMLSWASQNATACAAYGGAKGDGWSGGLPLSGTISVTESVAGSFTYGISCTGVPPAASAQVAVDFSAGTVAMGGISGGKSGGGGAVDANSLLLLGLLACRKMRRRPLEHASYRGQH